MTINEKKKMQIPRLTIYISLFVTVTGIVLKDGGYEDVYVLIHESNDESDELIQRIQAVLTNASQLLFTATHNQIYFRKVKIIVPKSWKQKPTYKQLPTPPLKDSYFSVDKNGFKTPQAIGNFICGKTGKFIHLSHEFLMTKERTKWGLHANVVVHEWGHLRWGLFNEIPKKGNDFYLANGKWNPTRCTDDIKGKIVLKSTNKPSSKCDINDSSKTMHKDCVFIPDPNQNVDASLMGYTYIDKLSEFCDQSIEGVKVEHRHQNFAPTDHNEKCKYQSAWEVMRNHSDFQNVKQLSLSTKTDPEFEIIQETTSYRVFVLDTSGSMRGVRLKTLQQAMTSVIQQLILKGTWVAIVSFGTTATLVKDLTEVNTQQDRENLIKKIPSSVTGSTCIGCGLTEAKLVLTKKLGNIAQGEIILISDGEDTSDSVKVHVNTARQEIIDAKITVHTIAISQQADHLLGDIARETGGKYYAYLDNGGVGLISAFSQTLSSGLTSARNKNIMLVANKIHSVRTKQHNISFTLEEGMGHDTTFGFITPTDTDVQLQLTGPNGYNQMAESHGSIATLSIPDTAQAGEYDMVVTTGTIPKTVEYYVKADATSDDIVQVTSLLSTNNVDLSTGDLPVIFSEVSKGYLPILNATVTAQVETDGKICDMTLKDSGTDPDSALDDGVYSVYILPSCLHSGRVNVKVDVKGGKGETHILQSVTGAPSPDEVDERIEVYNSSFQRVQILEELHVTNYRHSTTSDWIAPGKISDVSVHNIQTQTSKDVESRNFTISWTATGDDKNKGRASSYIFRIADDFDFLLNNFDNASLLEVNNDSLIPKHSGETEVLKIVIDADKSYTGTAFFAIQAVDESGNKGSVSNIVSIVVAKGYRAVVEEGTLDINEDFENEEASMDIADGTLDSEEGTLDIAEGTFNDEEGTLDSANISSSGVGMNCAVTALMIKLTFFCFTQNLI